MSDKKNQVRETIIDGVRVIEDGNVTHFIPVEDKSVKPKTQTEYKSVWKKICDWWNDDGVRPYVKARDLSDPFGDHNDDRDDGGGHKTGYEIGIRFKF